MKGKVLYQVCYYGDYSSLVFKSGIFMYRLDLDDLSWLKEYEMQDLEVKDAQEYPWLELLN